jgi:hypothetical protein
MDNGFKWRVKIQKNEIIVLKMCLDKKLIKKIS